MEEMSSRENNRIGCGIVEWCIIELCRSNEGKWRRKDLLHVIVPVSGRGGWIDLTLSLGSLQGSLSLPNAASALQAGRRHGEESLAQMDDKRL